MTAAPHPVPESGARPTPGLRERKKAKTRTAIREATFRLVRTQGYEATTVEQIADAAEVSPSTVFRYFPVKEDIVLTDEYGRVLEDALRDRPAGEPLLDSLRTVLHGPLAAALRADDDLTRLRTRLMVDVPAVRSRMMQSMSVTGRMLCRVLADRTGRHPDDLDVRILAMGIAGALLEVSLYWAERDYRDDLTALLDRALTALARGLDG
ncbi:TetR/AcrR family transcriptional regulator [Streptomyces sp. NPDC058045]|uniref:TetR/AcrR family transcriptional regulator n=1 Tax=Streptomyces sp. NPDC058045 TaxID=3346311 RepID=UPI0036EDA83F